VRLEVPAGGKAVSQLTHAVESAGGVVTALDVTNAGHEKLRIDVTCAARDTDHAQAIVDQLEAVEGVVIHKVSDRTFLMHLGGKIEMVSKVPLRNRDELSMAYTPGVARVSMAIARNKEDARRLTIKRNSVAVVTDGSAVLGLGNIGPEAALPVMEGKAALFKRFAPHGNEMTHPGEPVRYAGALFGHLLEDPGPSVAGDIVVSPHVVA
jgi:malate dehydrogenase (oxaloacetate-decarboxylating)